MKARLPSRSRAFFVPPGGSAPLQDYPVGKSALKGPKFNETDRVQGTRHPKPRAALWPWAPGPSVAPVRRGKGCPLPRPSAAPSCILGGPRGAPGLVSQEPRRGLGQSSPTGLPSVGAPPRILPGFKARPAPKLQSQPFRRVPVDGEEPRSSELVSRQVCTFAWILRVPGFMGLSPAKRPERSAQAA